MGTDPIVLPDFFPARLAKKFRPFDGHLPEQPEQDPDEPDLQDESLT
jgi:hypothetical protein